ncbi:hypothetical protein UFOVP1188_43 [uncultured Caudovirales phage]|uniref:Uncharacterized protein n=1 Tax=uncultured Caudovirales phage TaxID=2100421 RepID=A0A6J5R0J4_9CAUD|nr:hypothetical protein UFOVP1029_43 [uncultured Caudovirales phage]CAB4185254.1 hypothetical protein UFOVP1129_43 [uncultured Caudovirales phage]CAB4189431.1 hypothetical protein UFOVP1188_43 [uncultured Caudovirales phage]CAB4217035.1 hypothetical protein UFOVP1490_4 [uncultured Caudovirales phage]CAB4220571.1 hypothetical protein UFOVP1633_43 [uncultured Caudovirales phage]
MSEELTIVKILIVFSLFFAAWSAWWNQWFLSGAMTVICFQFIRIAMRWRK